MSEFKFACPVCGQHITCDTGSSGSQMDCPTCFRKLVVPQAKSAGATTLVLSATEVQKRPLPLPGNGHAGADQPVASRKTFSLGMVALVVVVVGAAGAGVYYFRERIFPSQSPKSLQVVSQPGTAAPVVFPFVPAPAHATNWTLNLAEAKIPNEPASGRVNERGFQLDRSVIQLGRLDLRQGPKWPPDLGVSVHLFAERTEDLAGKTVVIEATRPTAPRVILRWKNEQGDPVNKDYRQGYALRVEFGAVTNNRLPGKIFIALPDAPRSYVAGTFNAEIRRPAPKP